MDEGVKDPTAQDQRDPSDDEAPGARRPLSAEQQPSRGRRVRALETDSHLYFLTDTRLYVLSGDRLEALVDVFHRGDLLVGDTGFGLVDRKAVSWFSPTGRPVGGVRTKDPILRVLSTPQGLVVETRQHRATAVGPLSWWRS